jgi:uncharacterized protein (DUF2267 family)
VAARAELTPEDAERAACATLETLSELLTWGLASELAQDLPDEARAWLLAVPDGELSHFHADEFVRRVAERGQLDGETAGRQAGAVLSTLARVVPRRTWDEVIDRLPNDYRPLMRG